jgi:hypothetical protein
MFLFIYFISLGKDLPICRSVHVLQNAKSQLEAKVEEIQIRLSVEARVRQNAEKDKEELTKALEESKQKHIQELSEAKKKYLPSNIILLTSIFMST